MVIQGAPPHLQLPPISHNSVNTQCRAQPTSPNPPHQPLPSHPHDGAQVKSQRPQNAPPLPGVLIANKIDLRSDEPDAPAVVSTEEGATLAKNEGLDFFETSAAQQTDVDMPFHFIAHQFHKKYQETVKKSEQLSMAMM